MQKFKRNLAPMTIRIYGECKIEIEPAPNQNTSITNYMPDTVLEVLNNEITVVKDEFEAVKRNDY